MDYPHKINHKSPRICRTFSPRRKRRVPSIPKKPSAKDSTKKFMANRTKWIKKNPHVLSIILLFVLLFWFNVLNLISSLCLGFVAASLSDFFAQSFFEWRKEKRKEQEKIEESQKPKEEKKVVNRSFEVNSLAKPYMPLKQRGNRKL